ncbi:hypothetical protein SUGI_0289580 [Cryptomeria japonica]|uniref:uncharacterized protein LOC131874661 n=1 Tax=Cryptomeria japonica TaxID=3369 RepID=UPI002408DFF2|nr:uncharacterized protein LOC131874661 [Cryptomeria japonica]GLJ16806.1 hypothetical protein SUGI_0289580 [Cryptomeria japonica]
MDSENPEQCSQEISCLICPCTKHCFTPSDPDGINTATLESTSALNCFEFDSQTGHSTSVSSSDYDLIYQEIELQFKPKRRSRRSDRGKRNRVKQRENVCRARQACNCAASFAADCAAICCCPCVLLNLVILAFVRIPCAFAARAVRYAKKKARINTNSNHKERDDDDGGGDEMREKRNYYTPPWSCIVSPQTSSPLQRSLSSKLDTDTPWAELYAAGHLGFGGAVI